VKGDYLCLSDPIAHRMVVKRYQSGQFHFKFYGQEVRQETKWEKGVDWLEISMGIKRRHKTKTTAS
jgi:hypothetical protein